MSMSQAGDLIYLLWIHSIDRGYQGTLHSTDSTRTIREVSRAILT